ncbi:MAG: glycine cleavage system protein GcvH [Planctomycetota bacterium]|jgi:glycine cleavage system H protein
MVVEGLLYTKEHEWAKVEGKTVIIGITDYAQEQLGEVTYIELPEVGKELEENDEIGVVESSKAASDVFTPVAGKVAEVNENLESKPELINEDCYKGGWLCKIEISEDSLPNSLMDSKQYDEYLKEV